MKRSTVQGTHDNDQTAPADDGDRLEPREAARMLAETERDAKREFNMSPRWITLFGGAVIVVAYGALWLSTRGQHPYTGPSFAVLALVYVAVIVSIAVSVKVYRRATAGVNGPSVSQQQLEGVAILVSFILGSPVIQGATKNYGASHAIVYGVIPAAAPLIIVGTTVLGIAASKADWPRSLPRSQSSSAASSPPSSDRARVARSRDRAGGRGRRLRRRDRQATQPRLGSPRWTPTRSTRVIHAPARLRIVVTLAALSDGDSLSFTRLQDMLEADARQPDHAPPKARGRRLPDE